MFLTHFRPEINGFQLKILLLKSLDKPFLGELNTVFFSFCKIVPYFVYHRPLSFEAFLKYFKWVSVLYRKSHN